MYWQTICKLLLVIAQVILAQISVFDSLDLIRNSISSCVEAIAQNYFSYDDIVTFTMPVHIGVNTSRTTVMERMILTKLYNSSNFTVLVKQAKSYYSKINFVKKSHGYIIQIHTEYEIFQTLQYLQDVAWNPRGRFIIISSCIYENKNMIVAQIAEILWQQKVLDFIIILPKQRDSIVLNVYTWFPYAELNNCGADFNETPIIDQCTNGIMKENVNMFPNKIPNNLHGCPVYVRTVIWPPYIMPPKTYNRSESGIEFTEGLEILLLNTIANKANFTIVYSLSKQIQDWGSVYNNGTVTGMFKKILDEHADIAISSLAATVNRYEYFESSIHYSTETIVWCVPHAREVLNWMLVFNAFAPKWWFIILVTYAMVSVCLWSLSYRHRQESTAYHSVSNIFINMIGVFVSSSVNIKPRIDTVRSLFLIWTFFSLILVTIYQTNMTISLMTTVFEHQISTVREIVESELPFGYLQTTRLYFNTNRSKVERILINKAVICQDAYKCLTNIALYRNYCFAVPKLYFTYIERNFQDKNGQLMIYKFNTDYITFPVQMYTYKGFSLLNRIDELISRIKQTGLLNKWEEEVREVSQKPLDGHELIEDTDNVLQLKHFQGAIFFYAIGMAISFIIFSLELLLYRYTNRADRIIIPFTN